MLYIVKKINTKTGTQFLSMNVEEKDVPKTIQKMNENDYIIVIYEQSTGKDVTDNFI